MPWDPQIGDSRGAVMDERFNGGGCRSRVRGWLFAASAIELLGPRQCKHSSGSTSLT